MVWSLLWILPALCLALPLGLFAAVCICSGRKHRKSAAPCVIVLGARVYADGSLSHSLQYRCDAALELWRRGGVSCLLLCGGAGRDEPVTEASAMARYLAEQGVPAEDMLLEAESVNTIENLKNARALMQARGYDRAALVTSDYHLTRALWIARDAGLQVCGVPAASPRGWKRYLKARFKESVSWCLYFLKKLK